ncbi:MAG: FAD-binding oxidoreductase [Actinomycetota bacterium]
MSGTIEQAAISKFEDSFTGEVITPGGPAYEAARHVWNASIDKRPALIVRPGTTADVAAAVRFAREQDLLLAVRGGAHSVAGHGTCDGGLVIDLSGMKRVDVDASARRARVQGGCVWGDVDAATQSFGLATTGGLISSTGVGGFTLGGGVGWIQRKYGLSCDNLISVELVTANGNIVEASDDNEPELMWGLRGGGGNFGIVTSFEFQLHPVGPEIMAGMILFPGDRARDVLEFYREQDTDAPAEMGLGAVLRLAPAAPFVPEDVQGTPVVALAAVHCGSLADGERGMKPIKDLGEPIADLITARPYLEMQRMLDASWLEGFQNYWKAEFMTGIPDAAIDALIEYLQTITSPLSDFKFPLLGGAIARVGEDDTAYSHRSAPFVININSRWADPDDSERHIAWTRSLWDAMQPFSDGGVYSNFMDADEAGRLEDSFGAAKFERLRALKRKYDPANLFRVNQNIEP